MPRFFGGNGFGSGFSPGGGTTYYDVAFVNAGAAAAGSTSLAVPWPASPVAGNLAALTIANKFPTNGPTTPTDWTLPSNGQASGGIGVNGTDSGNVYCTVYYFVLLGTESGNLSVTITSGNSAVGRIFQYSKTGGAWDIAAVNGTDLVADASWAITYGANPGIRQKDMILVASAINTDDYTYSGQALTVTGCTLGTETERQDSGTITGSDCALMVSDHVIASGTATAAPTYAATSSGTDSSVRPGGASVLLRIRAA